MEFVPPSEFETPPVSDMVTSAVYYIQRRWRVMPVHSITDQGMCTCRTETCSSPGKHPRTKNGVKDATTEYARVLDWWLHEPGANVGVATGTGLLVIDIDPRHGGSLEALEQRFHLPLTAKVLTGGGGWHLYYRYNPRIYTLPNTAGKLGEGIDSRGENGYVLAPPSRHVSGGRYVWRWDGPVCDAPVALLQELLKTRPSIHTPAPPAPVVQTAPTPGGQASTLCIPEGKRNTSLFHQAAQLRRLGADEQVLFLVLSQINKGMCQPPLSDEEVRQICASAARWSPEASLDGDRQFGLDALIGSEVLLSREIPDPQWAVPGFLPEGVTLLAGKPKMGKSWLALDLALAVSRGGLALGSLPTNAGHVLYLGLEDSMRRMADRMRLLLGDLPAPTALTWGGVWLPLQEGGLENLETWLQTMEHVRLVIIDTLARVRPAGTGQVYADDYAALTPLKTLAEKYHVAILLIHHLRKNGASDPMDEVSGSTGLTGAADCIMVLQRERGQSQATLTITGRDVQDQSLAIAFDDSTARWRISQSPRSRPLSAERRAIIDVLREAGRPLSTSEIAASVDKSRGYVAKTLHHLVKQGWLQNVQRGLYELVQVADREEG